MSKKRQNRYCENKSRSPCIVNNGLASCFFYFSASFFSMKSIESGKRQTQVWLERVSIYGYASKPNQVVAVQGSSQETLEFKYESDRKALVLRKPALNMSKEWKITIN